jgi:predicted methyltransferase
MKCITRLATLAIVFATMLGVANAATIAEAIANDSRPDANTERDGARKPADMLAFIALEDGATVLDWGAGGGYWSELFSGVVGAGGKVYAHQNAGQRFDETKDALASQFEPFGNIELLPVARGEATPLADGSVDTVMVSYLYHHMHYSEDSGEMFPASSAALFSEFSRVLKPGGTVIVIEHIAADGSSRAQSAGWHRTPPETAKADITGVGFEFAGEAAELYVNPEDDKMNVWFETGLSGKTNTFVHKYRKPD